MGLLEQIRKVYQTTLELGLEKVSLFALYQIGLKSGYYRFITPIKFYGAADSKFYRTANNTFFPFTIFPTQQIRGFIQQPQDTANCLEEAETILSGQFHRYGGNLAPINLSNPSPAIHWSAIRDDLPDRDIKDIWEPARFGWVFPLARAYALTGDERYPSTFAKFFIDFINQNPPNAGPHWVSAQEVALRIIAFAFAWQVFQSSSSFNETFKQQIARSIAEHAERIPHTLIYARSQNNNHLISEAVGLFTAGVCLHDHPQAKKWKRLGSYWFHRALQMQIAPDGSYVQHSMNYHRLMLQLSLWFFTINTSSGEKFPQTSQDLLAKASQWMINQIEMVSGHAPNLGHNDGSNLYPFSHGEQTDYRSVAQAASRAFVGKSCFTPGIWNELSLWLGLDDENQRKQTVNSIEIPSVLKLGDHQSWATLRAAHFNDRPAHADQLHVDLWYRGFNIAQDAGTYRYTAPAPWRNALAGTTVHNTVTINQNDQMQRAGRFLWLKWAQAQILDQSNEHIVAQQDGYQSIGIIHQRELKYLDSHNWQIIESILPSDQLSQPPIVTLHWLLPNLPWEMQQNTLIAHHTQFDAFLSILLENPSDETKPKPGYQLVRAGEVLFGNGPANPISGWYSPTYGEKEPALSFSMTIQIHPPCKIVSKWHFIDKC